MQEFIIIAIALLVSLTFHEAAHAGMAYLLGDNTAKSRGRLSLNPIRHLDPLGTLVFALTRMIGWGKPVPVNPQNFKNPIKDNALVALAGPFSNFLISISILIPLKYLPRTTPEFIVITLLYIFHISIFLGIFNLLPFPPLDGSKILGLIIPHKFYRQYINFLQNGAKYSIAIFLFDALILGRILHYSLLTIVLSHLHDMTSWILNLST